MASAPMWKLRRLAPRAKRVIERRKDEAPVMLAYEASLVPAADTFIAAYDQAARIRATWQREHQEGRDAITALASSVRTWLPLVARHIGGFDSSAFLDTAVPDDVVRDAERLVTTVQEHTDASGVPLAYREPLVAEVTALVEAARKEYVEAESADQGYQQSLVEARAAAELFDVELQAFRKTLLTLLGRADKDYQKLRARRASQRDEDDDADAPLPPDDGEDDIADGEDVLDDVA